MSTVTITLPRRALAGARRPARLGIDPGDLDRRLRAGRAIVVDTRPPEEFDAGHIPGALNVSGDRAWRLLPALLPDGATVAVVAPTPDDARWAAVRVAARAACDAALVAGGLARWSSRGLPVQRGLAIDARRAMGQLAQGGVALIDARSASAFAEGHVVGSVNVPLDDWRTPRRALPRLPLMVAAETGEAAATAASLFRAAGHGCVWRVDGGGIEELLDAGAAPPLR
jgi:rhodanese-related sulfurtransferase